MARTNFFSITILIFLMTNSFIHGQKKTEWLPQLDSLLADTFVRLFNDEVLMTQKGKTLYSKVHGYANLTKKEHN